MYNIWLLHEYCPEQYIILHEPASAIWYIARHNIDQLRIMDFLRGQYVIYGPVRIFNYFKYSYLN